jgi:hypothetical protein
MTKAKTAKYPTLRARVTQEQYDKAYRNGWPNSVKEFINNIKEKTNDKKAKTSAVNSSK